MEDYEKLYYAAIAQNATLKEELERRNNGLQRLNEVNNNLKKENRALIKKNHENHEKVQEAEQKVKVDTKAIKEFNELIGTLFHFLIRDDVCGARIKSLIRTEVELAKADRGYGYPRYNQDADDSHDD